MDISGDRVSGARELILKMLDYARELLNSGCDVEKIENFLLDVSKARKSIASLYNLSKILIDYIKKFGFNELKNVLINLHKYVSESTSRIFENFRNISPSCRSFITISKSSTILEVFKRLGSEYIDEIYVLESYPLGEGIDLSKALKKLGFKVILIPDSALGIYVKNIDCVVVGADAVFVDGFVNKVGTFLLALSARYYLKKFYVLADSTKILPTKSFYEIELLDIKEFHGKDISNIDILAPLFEFIPRNLVTMYITENGLFPPENVLESRKKFLEKVFGVIF